MIKIFRQIRKSLLEQNQMGKYFKYAIGEILLVVIGILIALQVNTWNENKKNTKTERSYLEGIVSNLDEDISELERTINQDTLTMSAYTSILLPFRDRDINVYSKKFIYEIGLAQFVNQFNGNSIVFEDMKSSGKINFIQSDALRFAILEYYNLSSSVIQNHITNNNLISKLKDEAFTTNLDLNSIIDGFAFKDPYRAEIDPLDLSFFKKDKNDKDVKVFANRLSLMKGYVNVNYQRSGFLYERAKKLKELILSYLGGTDIDYAFMPKEIVNAITNNDIDVLNSSLSDEALNTCYQLVKNYPISYLSLSIERGALESAKYLVKRGADLELTCFDKTPLMYASKHGHLEMVKVLLMAGADINVVSVEGKTALDYAINYKHPEVEGFLRSYKVGKQ